MIREIEKTEAATGRMSGDKRRSQILQVASDYFPKKVLAARRPKKSRGLLAFRKRWFFVISLPKASCITRFSTIKRVKAAIRIRLNGQAMRCWKDDQEVFYRLSSRATHEQDPNLCGFCFIALEGHELAEIVVAKHVPMYEFFMNNCKAKIRHDSQRIDRALVFALCGRGFIIRSTNLWDTKRRLLDISNEKAARSFAEILLNGIKK